MMEGVLEHGREIDSGWYRECWRMVEEMLFKCKINVGTW